MSVYMHVCKTGYLLSRTKSLTYISDNLFYLYFASILLMQQMATLSKRNTTFVTSNMK